MVCDLSPRAFGLKRIYGIKETGARSNICIAGRFHSDVHNILNRECEPYIAHFERIVEGQVAIRNAGRRWTVNFVNALRVCPLPKPPNTVKVGMVHVEKRIWI